MGIGTPNDLTNLPMTASSADPLMQQQPAPATPGSAVAPAPAPSGPSAPSTNPTPYVPSPEGATDFADINPAIGPPPPRGGVSESLATQLARNVDKAGVAPGPGGWAKGILSGLVTTLSGANVGNVPAGAGFFYGAAKAADAQRERNLVAQARQDKLTQQARENARQDMLVQSEADKNIATTAQANANMIHEQAVNSFQDDPSRKKSIDSGAQGLKQITTGKDAAQVIQESIPGSRLKQLMSQGKLDPTKSVAFHIGERPIPGQYNPDGTPAMEALYTVTTIPPEVTLNDESSKFLSDNTGQKYLPGQVMPGYLYRYVDQQAMATQTAVEATNKMLRDNKLDELNTDEKIAVQKAAPAWIEALSKTGHDDIKALAYLETPEMKEKYPGAAQVMAESIGPDKLETMRHNREEEHAKNVENNIKVAELDLKKNEAEGTGGSRDFMTDDLKSQIAALPSDKQKFLNQFDPEQRGSILSLAFSPGDIDFKEVFTRMAKGQKGLTPQQAENAIHQINPNWTTSQYKLMQDAYKKVTTGTVGQQINNYSNVLEHSAAASDVMENSWRKMNPEFLNKPLNWVEQHTTGTEATEIQNALIPVREEYALLNASGHAPHAEELKAYQTALSETSTPAQIETALKVIGGVGAVRLDNLNNEYRRIAGRNVPGIVTQKAMDAAEHLNLDPNSLATLKRISLDPTGKQNLSDVIFHNPEWKPPTQAEIQQNQNDQTANTDTQQATVQLKAQQAVKAGSAPKGAVGTAKFSNGQYYYIDANKTALGPVVGVAPSPVSTGNPQ